MRGFLNRLLINSYPEIIEELRRHYRLIGRPATVAGRLWLALTLFLRYGLFRRDPVTVRDKKRQRLSYPESTVTQPISPAEWETRIAGADTVVFDAWKALLLPLIDQKQAGVMADVRDGHLGLGVLISAGCADEEAVRDAAAIFCDLTIDQPFVHRLYDGAIRSGKQVLICNSMEWIGDAETDAVLKRFGYPGVNRIGGIPENALWISSDRKDNLTDVRLLGSPYRAWRSKNVLTSVYDGIVDLHLHSGEHKEDLFYEYGFVCGGILTAGYCQFLNRLARQEGIDRFLFFARDGYIMEQVYQRYFEEKDHAYLLVSRFALLELIFSDDPMEYLYENVRTRIFRDQADNSVRNVLRECGLQILEPFLGEASFTGEDILTEKLFPKFCDWILSHKKEIEGVFSESREAAKEYYLSMIGDAGHVCLVDIGWRATSAAYLKKLFSTLCRWDGKTTGTLIGAQALYSNFSDAVKTRIQCGEVHTFAFESEEFRRCGKTSVGIMPYEEVVCVEALFSSQADTLLRYCRSADGGVGFIYGNKNENAEKIRQIHRGILDFCEQFVPIIKRYGLTVTPRDAYAPLDAAMRNRKYKKLIFDSYREVSKAINGF
ncbi:MAG: hypothetical protein K6G16_06745 [Lachnospiraceae bacterium]|nr:hypothetical protein [Lachnospiraceae bacterium]